MGTLTAKQHTFALEYLKDFNLARAAAEAKIASKNFYAAGYNLLQQQAVRDIIAIEIAKREQTAAVDGLYVIQKLVAVVEADIVEWALAGESGVGEDKIASMPPHIRKLVKEITKETTTNSREKETTTKFKIKFMDKDRAIELLGKYAGLFDKKLQVDLRVETYADWTKRMIAEKEQQIIDVSSKND